MNRIRYISNGSGVMMSTQVFKNEAGVEHRAYFNPSTLEYWVEVSLDRTGGVASNLHQVKILLKRMLMEAGVVFSVEARKKKTEVSS